MKYTYDEVMTDSGMKNLCQDLGQELHQRGVGPWFRPDKSKPLAAGLLDAWIAEFPESRSVMVEKKKRLTAGYEEKAYRVTLYTGVHPMGIGIAKKRGVALILALARAYGWMDALLVDEEYRAFSY